MITQSDIELSERLRKECLNEGIKNPRYVAQDSDGTWCHYEKMPEIQSTQFYRSEFTVLFFDKPNNNWRETLMEWNPDAGVPLADILQNTCEHCGNQILKSHEQS